MTAPDRIPVVTVAGSDPTGGAGLQADLKTFAAHGVDGTAVVTAVTVQGRGGVRRVEGMPADLVGGQVRAVLEEVRPRAAKTGMLWDGAVAREVAARLRSRDFPLVVDPVLSATSGGSLAAGDLLVALREDLLPLADLVTPNLAEAAALLGVPGLGDADLEGAASALLRSGARAVLLKGGHGSGPESVDLLADRSGTVRLALPRIEAPALHGTGCVLSAAIASRLARGEDLRSAVRAAKALVHAAIARAARRGAGASLFPLPPA